MAKYKNKAFTIIELVVAMGLLIMLVGLSSVVFSTTVKAHRKATATIEITRNLRVLTEQLNADFQGLRKDTPVMFWFELQLSGTTETRFDMIHFFADGDFQTSKQYNDGTGSKTIYGNIARVFYGHVNSVDLLANLLAIPDFRTCQVLSRKSHILTADSDILTVYGEIPLITNAGLTDYGQFDTNFGLTVHSGNTHPDENTLEFNTITLTNWINALNYLDVPGNLPNNANWFIAHCLTDVSRPYINLADFETLHLLMAQGVMDYSIQWAYTSDDLVDLVGAPLTGTVFTGVRWWPSIDPDGDGNTVNSDFAVMSKNRFGVYFALPGGTNQPGWTSIRNCATSGGFFSDTFYPKALKFTFRLKDSNNIFPDGKTFTHIVYIDN